MWRRRWERVKTMPDAELSSTEPIVCGGHSEPVSVIIVGKAESFVPSNRIEVGAEWASAHGFVNRELVLVKCEGEPDEMEGCIIVRPKKEGADDGIDSSSAARTTQRVMDHFKISSHDEQRLIVTKRSESLFVEHVAVQKVDRMREGSIAVSSDIYEQLELMERSSGSKRRRYYRINHLASGSLCFFPFDKIELDTELGSKSIKLSRYQRTLLNLNKPPCSLDEVQMHLIKNADVEPEEKEYVLERYRRDPQFIADSHDEKKAIMKVLRSWGYDRLQITVSEFDELANPIARAPKALSGFFVGNSSILLKACRPYGNDEDRSVVRLSPSTMIHLGIGESDKVILRHGKSKVKARALAMDSLTRAQETNNIACEADIDSAVGIPAYTRRALDVSDLDEAVLVERDTGYLFRKNLNAQFLPVLVFFLTLVQTERLFDSIELGYWALIAIVGLPVIAYIMLSEQRAKVK